MYSAAFSNFTTKHFYDGIGVSAVGRMAKSPFNRSTSSTSLQWELGMLGRAQLPMYNLIRVEAISKERAPDDKIIELFHRMWFFSPQDRQISRIIR